MIEIDRESRIFVMTFLTSLIVLSLFGLVIVSRKVDASMQSIKIHARLDSVLAMPGRA